MAAALFKYVLNISTTKEARLRLRESWSVFPTVSVTLDQACLVIYISELANWLGTSSLSCRQRRKIGHFGNEGRQKQG
jgi:hypothetical protein